MGMGEASWGLGDPHRVGALGGSTHVMWTLGGQGLRVLVATVLLTEGPGIQWAPVSAYSEDALQMLLEAPWQRCHWLGWGRPVLQADCPPTPPGAGAGVE